MTTITNGKPVNYPELTKTTANKLKDVLLNGGSIIERVKAVSNLIQLSQLRAQDEKGEKSVQKFSVYWNDLSNDIEKYLIECDGAEESEKEFLAVAFYKFLERVEKHRAKTPCNEGTQRNLSSPVIFNFPANIDVEKPRKLG